MSATTWTEVDPAELAPVVLVVGGALTTPGSYRPMAAALRARGAAEVVIAPVYLPDWILASVRGLGPVTTRVGRALLEAGARSAADPGSRGAPILYVGHSGGGIVGRLLTSPEPFEGRRLGASGRIGALVTLGTPHLVDDDTRWGRPMAAVGIRFVNRHVPGACFAPTTGYLAVASRCVAVHDPARDTRSRYVRRVYEEFQPAPDQPIVAGDGVVPLGSALLPGARHIVLDDALHGPGVHTPWYGHEGRLEAWWPVALEVWRDALQARQERRRQPARPGDPASGDAAPA
ncbi:MAG TPA: esterase [Patescibacteria group bacterium]|nr:esterase [Patescibacteria group bacterium]